MVDASAGKADSGKRHDEDADRPTDTAGDQTTADVAHGDPKKVEKLTKAGRDIDSDEGSE